MTSSPSDPVLPARVFRASKTFTLWPALLVLFNAICILILWRVHQIIPMPLFGAIGIAFLGIFLSAVTLRVTMDADGLAQRWLWGKGKVSWHEIAAIERVHRALLGDGLFLLNDKDREIFAVSSLALPDQELITEEAIKRARLRRDKKPLKRGIKARWVRK